MSAQPKKPGQELNFEKAMDRLEAIVEQMESGKMLLEELIVRYEEGMTLVKICQERLASAEQRIEIITRNSAGKPAVKAFQPATETSPTPRAQVEEGNSENDEVRLF
jgi:exodeoxyribonuclease VII small subunit